MSRITIVTDSNSGILQAEGKELGVTVIPMPFTINMDEFFEELSITQDEFYDYLAKGVDVTTSQPSEYYLEELWEGLLQDYDELVYIPMTSGLSKTCENAMRYAERFDGKVQVVDNKRISVTLKESVLEAIQLAKEGKSAKEIKEILEADKGKANIYIMMGVLKYLKKGGRISSTAATVAEALRIKPILWSKGDNFEKFALAMSVGQAKKKMINQLIHDLETEFKQEYENGQVCISLAHTQNFAEAQKFKDEIIKNIPNVPVHFVDPLSLSVSCHIGPGALACTVTKTSRNNK
ncbi:MAG: DegV family protein [Clostridia bacterium]|nr:DegV family protein [Clostridia bacterium]